MFYVYMLRCSDGSYYVGHTENLEKRLAEHKSAFYKNCFTAKRLPVELVYVAEFETRDEAFVLERKIKRWKKSKKIALANKEWDLLSELAKKIFV